MTDAIYFDTDCLSSFLWVKEFRILLSLFKGRIHIPYAVYVELSYPSVKHFKTEIDSLIVKGVVFIDKFEPGSKEEEIYYRLVYNPENGKQKIGKGEASVIAFAKENDGTLASNNLKDVGFYIDYYKLKSLSTPTILLKAVSDRLLSDIEADLIWDKMTKKKQRFPYETFAEYKKSIT